MQQIDLNAVAHWFPFYALTGICSLIEITTYTCLVSILCIDWNMVQVGAIEGDEELTPLGYHLAKLPVDVLIGKVCTLGL